MNEFVYWLPIGDFSLELLISVFLFMIPLNKREHYHRTLFSHVLCIIVVYLLLKALPLPPVCFFLGFGITILLSISMFWHGADCCFWDAVFGFTCGYAIQHMSYACSEIIRVVLKLNKNLSDIIEFILFLLLAILGYKTVVLRISKNGKYLTSSRDSVAALVLLLGFAFLLNVITEQSYQSDNLYARSMFIVCKLFAVLCCGFILWIHTSIYKKIYVENELNTERQIWQMQKSQYELSKVNIDVINQKCHDLKHQLQALRSISDDASRETVLKELEESVLIYDAAVKTGNKALDTILTERSLQCERLGIKWTCMADASRMSFINTIDLYTIMGNVLDNAIESVSTVSQKERRVITVNAHCKEDLAIIRVSNYYEHEIIMKNGIPQTTKEDVNYHGFGTKGIIKTVEKYNGSVSFHTDQNIFTICIIIPCTS
ncbi:MAG: ATP-binding protein [Lachnospiraceae bacterium]|nr:ATP-binding protein [Lachnospiraceae bacterium]